MDENIKVTADKKKMPVPKKKATATATKQPKENTLKGIMTAFVERMAQAVDDGEYTVKRRTTKNTDPNWKDCTLIIDGMEIECSMNKEYQTMTWHPHMSVETAFMKALDGKFKGKREKKLVMEADTLD